MTAPEIDQWAGVPRFDEDELTTFVQQLFEAAGLGVEAARLSAESLLVADRRGIESHGVARIPGYIRRLRNGMIDAEAMLTVDRETPSTIAFNGNNGLGLIMGRRAMERCVAKAEETGVCMATVRNSNHFGIAGTYALMAAERGLGGMAMTNSSAIVVPMFGRESLLGTNPLAFAVPTGDKPFCLDMSTSTVSFGKIEIARRAGMPIPPGWGVDDEGRMTTNADDVRGLLPLGGSRETCGHKGYGLGLMVEVMCSHMAQNTWSHQIGASYVSDAPTSGTGHAFIAWRVDAFRDLDEFKADMDDMIARIRDSAVSDDYPGKQVLIPGDPEADAEAYNREHGIPVRQTVLAEMTEVANECGIEVPFSV